jgi:small membrane protein
VVIKLLLLLGLVVVPLAFLRNRNAMRFQAGKKIGLAAFALLWVISVVDPDVMNWLANRVGVGRGADLLLYVTVVGFLFVTLNTYLKFKDYDDRLTVLARGLAIEEARQRQAVRQPPMP